MKDNWSEILVSIILLVFVVFLLNPLDFWMPQPVQMMSLVAVAALFIIFSAFVWHEKATDEREQLHRHISARIAYLAGTAILVTGVIMQSLKHALDPWLVIALAVMVLGKVAGLIYSRSKY